VTYGEDAGADVRAEDVVLDDAGRASFDVVHGAHRARVSLALHGRHHVSNALAVAGVALALGIGLDPVADALTRARPASRWRMEVVESSTGATVVNDAYNANPESVRAALEALVAMARPTATRGPRRAVAVLGEMRELGDLSVSEHEEIGRTAVRLGVARLVAVGDSVAVRALADAAEREQVVGGASVDVVRVAGVEDAVEHLVATVDPSDVVLVKASRGIGLERVVAGLLERTGEAS
jgi:UDP-N-acetylmuramoyl-tripeptide--D-alanyl-D-alanine ligase